MMTEEVKRLIKENIEVFKPKFEEFVSVCAWCGKWRSGDNWFGAPIPKGKRSHGICPECYKKFNAGVPYDEVTKTWLE
jgi:hypothetical protein